MNCSSKCWECANATSKYKCVWVRTLRLRPKGCKINNDGFIVECPKFTKIKEEQAKDE